MEMPPEVQQELGKSDYTTHLYGVFIFRDEVENVRKLSQKKIDSQIFFFCMLN